jgi:predicted RNA binding protein YcfA (HicA-like mRNA interferase family)
MSNVPSVSGKDAVKAFRKLGFVEARIQGSHVILKMDGNPNLLTIPVHGNSDLKTGTLRGLIKASGFTLEQFLEQL